MLVKVHWIRSLLKYSQQMKEKGHDQIIAGF